MPLWLAAHPVTGQTIPEGAVARGGEFLEAALTAVRAVRGSSGVRGRVPRPVHLVGPLTERGSAKEETGALQPAEHAPLGNSPRSVSKCRALSIGRKPVHGISATHRPAEGASRRSGRESDILGQTDRAGGPGVTEARTLGRKPVQAGDAVPPLAPSPATLPDTCWCWDHPAHVAANTYCDRCTAEIRSSYPPGFPEPQSLRVEP